jgi:hypothetical protein
VNRDYYMRQPDVLRIYGGICGWTLARAHARSGDPIAIGAYLGSGFDDAISDFANSYADQNELDHQVLVESIKGRTVGRRSRGLTRRVAVLNKADPIESVCEQSSRGSQVRWAAQHRLSACDSPE